MFDELKNKHDDTYTPPSPENFYCNVGQLEKLIRSAEMSVSETAGRIALCDVPNNPLREVLKRQQWVLDLLRDLQTNGMKGTE